MNLGDKYCAIIEMLVVPKGKHALQPFILQPYQREFVSNLFKQDENGNNSYRTGMLFLPKQNGKTLLAAAIIVASMLLNKEHNAYFASAALSREQAALVFDAAVAMIEADDELKDMFVPTRSQKKLVHIDTASVYMAMSKETKDRNGRATKLFLYDEVGEAYPDIWNKIVTGQVSVDNAITIGIGTAGDVGTLGHDLYLRAVAAKQNPTADPRFYSMIFEAPDGADFKDLDVWRKCNPGFGITINEQNVKDLITEATNNPAKINVVERYHLNKWVNSSNKWISVDVLDRNKDTIDPQSILGTKCWIGVDLSTTIDVTCASMIFPQQDGRLFVYPRFYIPKDTAIEKEKKEGRPWITWGSEAQGLVCLTPGSTIDYEYLRKDINALGKLYDIKGITFDRYNADQIGLQLKQDGFEVTKMGQGYESMTSPCREFERLMVSGKFVYNNNPVAKWMMQNVVATMDAAGNLKPDKEKSREKIDFIAATLTAIGAWLKSGETAEPTTKISFDQMLQWI